MADGLSGSMAMEMGQKVAGNVKKTVNQFAQAAKQQITGQAPIQQGTGVSNSPSEVAPKQAGGFDLGSIFDEKNPFASTQQNPQQTAQMQQQLAQDAAKQKAEDAAKIEQLRKQLHEMYYDDFVKKAEGKDKKKEEPVAEKLEKEDQEKKQKEMVELEEKKKKEEVPLAFRKKSTGELGRAKG